MQTVNNTVSQTVLAETIYNAAIPFMPKMSAWAHRQILLLNARRELANAKSATTFCNNAKLKAVKEGKVADYGRAVNPKIGPRTPADAAVEAEMNAAIAQALRIVKGEETIALNFKWLVIDKATNTPVDGADSKNKAYKIKDNNPALVVRKAA